MANSICENFINDDEKSIGFFSIDSSYNITSWSSGASAFFGYSEIDVVGKSLFDTIVPAHSKDGFIEDMEAKREFDFVEFEFKTKDGNSNFLNTTVRYGDVISFMILALKKEQKTNLQELISQRELKDVVISIDKNGYIKEFNKEASILTGYRKEEVIERNFIEVLLPKTYEEKVFAQIQNSFRKKHPIITDSFPIICKDGSRRKVYWNYKIYTHKHRDLRLYLTSFNQTRESIETQKLDYLASYDLLTDLPNKNLFLTKLQSSIDKVATSRNLNLMLIYLDIKNFKSLNLVLGIKSADRLLQMVAKRLNSKLRDYDIIARLDGDRFAIVVDDLENDIYSSKIIDRVMEIFKQSFEIEGNRVTLDVSVGVSFYPSDANDIDRLINSAELALSKAKNSNKSDFRFFMPSMYDEITKKIQMDKAIKEALVNDEFFVVFQPQVDSQTKKIVGAEALVRWEHPELKNIPPLDFIPVAEDNGLILEIGSFVLEESIKYAKGIHDRGWNDFEISINISSIQLLQSNLLDTVQNLLEKYNFNPNYLNLELTESVFMENLNLSIRKLQEFKSLGIKISIDDFGTGYSSLSYISSLPIDFIKIDQSFIKSMNKNKNPIVDAIISMAKALNLKVVAEGVENNEQYNYLKEKKCELIQGYFFSKPKKLENFKNFENNHKIEGSDYSSSEKFISEKDIKELIR